MKQKRNGIESELRQLRCAIDIAKAAEARALELYRSLAEYIETNHRSIYLRWIKTRNGR